MIENQFIKLRAAQTMGPKRECEAIINQQFINYAVSSSNGQVGAAIVTLAHGPNKRSNVATVDDIHTLTRKMPHLTMVQIYSTGMGEVKGPGLVNLSRVVEITEHEKFSSLSFVDGDEINVAGTVI